MFCRRKIHRDMYLLLVLLLVLLLFVWNFEHENGRMINTKQSKEQKMKLMLFVVRVYMQTACEWMKNLPKLVLRCVRQTIVTIKSQTKANADNSVFLAFSFRQCWIAKRKTEKQHIDIPWHNTMRMKYFLFEIFILTYSTCFKSLKVF